MSFSSSASQSSFSSIQHILIDDSQGRSTEHNIDLNTLVFICPCSGKQDKTISLSETIQPYRFISRVTIQTSNQNNCLGELIAETLNFKPLGIQVDKQTKKFTYRRDLPGSLFEQIIITPKAECAKNTSVISQTLDTTKSSRTTYFNKHEIFKFNKCIIVHDASNKDLYFQFNARCVLSFYILQCNSNLEEVNKRLYHITFNPILTLWFTSLELMHNTPVVKLQHRKNFIKTQSRFFITGIKENKICYEINNNCAILQVLNNEKVINTIFGNAIQAPGFFFGIQFGPIGICNDNVINRRATHLFILYDEVLAKFYELYPLQYRGSQYSLSKKPDLSKLITILNNIIKSNPKTNDAIAKHLRYRYGAIITTLQKNKLLKADPKIPILHFSISYNLLTREAISGLPIILCFTFDDQVDHSSTKPIPKIYKYHMGAVLVIDSLYTNNIYIFNNFLGGCYLLVRNKDVMLQQCLSNFFRQIQNYNMILLEHVCNLLVDPTQYATLGKINSFTISMQQPTSIEYTEGSISQADFNPMWSIMCKVSQYEATPSRLRGDGIIKL